VVTAGQEVVVGIAPARDAFGPILQLLHVLFGLSHLGGPVARDGDGPILLLLHPVGRAAGRRDHRGVPGPAAELAIGRPGDRANVEV
jgi:hypothetical protein